MSPRIIPESVACTQFAERKGGCPIGSHRVLLPRGVLPQQAHVLDSSLPIWSNEVLIGVDCLHIDSASLSQIAGQVQHDENKIPDLVLGIIQHRGKMQNPVTQSGGVLSGNVLAVGSKSKAGLQVGERIVTLVSTTLTPLHLDEVVALDLANHQLQVRGHAILFASGIFARLPGDLSRTTAMAAFDVCGAPAHTANLITPGARVLVIGCGRSGMLCLAAARRAGAGQITVCDMDEKKLTLARTANLADRFLHIDACDALGAVRTLDCRYDLTISCVNAAGTEMTAVLATEPAGTILFFGMTTSFSAAALGAEGVGSAVTMIIGNGYTDGHADFALELLRSDTALRDAFERLT